MILSHLNSGLQICFFMSDVKWMIEGVLRVETWKYLMSSQFHWITEDNFEDHELFHRSRYYRINRSSYDTKGSFAFTADSAALMSLSSVWLRLCQLFVRLKEITCVCLPQKFYFELLMNHLPGNTIKHITDTIGKCKTYEIDRINIFLGKPGLERHNTTTKTFLCLSNRQWEALSFREWPALKKKNYNQAKDQLANQLYHW